MSPFHQVWPEPSCKAQWTERGEKTKQTEEESGRQHQGMDRPGVRQVLEGSGEQEKMEETGCEIICGAPTTLAVKGKIREGVRWSLSMYACLPAASVSLSLSLFLNFYGRLSLNISVCFTVCLLPPFYSLSLFLSHIVCQFTHVSYLSLHLSVCPSISVCLLVQCISLLLCSPVLQCACPGVCCDDSVSCHSQMPCQWMFNRLMILQRLAFVKPWRCATEKEG